MKPLETTLMLAVLLLSMASVLPATTPISPDDPSLEYRGVFFPVIGSEQAELNRFTDEVLNDPNKNFRTDYADVQPGVYVRFRTASSSVTATFVHQVGEHNGDLFGVYQDGVRMGEIAGLTLNIASSNPGQPVTYQIVCPAYSNVAFTGLELDDGAALSACAPLNQPRYVAFGDSISHNAGTDASSDKSFPWLLSRMKEWELFNLAVGGSKASPPVGSMLDNESFDVATVLWGFNDWNSENNVPLYQSRMNQFLDNLRVHHNEPVYMITPIHTTKLSPNRNNGYTMNDYRDVVRSIVATRRAAGDANLFVINGEDLTTADDLYDGIHLHHAGAVSFANKLMDYVLLPPPTVPPDTPGDLTATTAAAREIHLNWTDNADNEIYFKIERLQGDTSNWTEIDTVGKDVTTFIDANLPLFTTFHYRVRAWNYLGDSACSNAAATSTWAHGDFDGDNDVDLSDFGHFQVCYSEDAGDIEAGCENADLDENGTVELLDFNIFANCMSGSNIPPTPGCAD